MECLAVRSASCTGSYQTLLDHQQLGSVDVYHKVRFVLPQGQAYITSRSGLYYHTSGLYYHKVRFVLTQGQAYITMELKR